jgi:hypothetical protein
VHHRGCEASAARPWRSYVDGNGQYLDPRTQRVSKAELPTEFAQGMMLPLTLQSNWPFTFAPK